jgi:hypothetical protein
MGISQQIPTVDDCFCTTCVGDTEVDRRTKMEMAEGQPMFMKNYYQPTHGRSEKSKISLLTLLVTVLNI